MVLATVALLLIPIFQMTTKHFEVEPLQGVNLKQKWPEFTLDSWMKFKYQPQLYKYLVENYGFRETAIRLYNQIHFKFYKKGNANVTVGIDNYLYEPWFINAYNGANYIGEEKILDQVEKLQKIKDTLSSLDKELLIVLAPGKVTFYPEYIPIHLRKEGEHITNYKRYRTALENTNISFIDANEWFRTAKDSSAYPLFPQTGTHWSTYGACVAYDSIIRNIKTNTAFNMVDTKLANIILKSEFKKDDEDVEKILNLMYPIKKFDMAYLQIKLLNKETAFKPTTVVISDSFFWNIFNNFPAKNKVFGKLQFWYYYGSVFPESYKTPIKAKDLDQKQVFSETDLFIIMACPATINKIGWGFIDDTYNFFYGEKAVTRGLNSKRKVYFCILNSICKKMPISSFFRLEMQSFTNVNS